MSDTTGQLARFIEEKKLMVSQIAGLDAEVDRLTTANTDLQQRLDAAEEALRVAQGEVRGYLGALEDIAGDEYTGSSLQMQRIAESAIERAGK